MRSNKKAILWALVLTLGTLVVCIVFYYTSNKNLLYDLSLTCFGSSLLSVVIAYAAYRAEKRSTMEDFWQEALDIIGEIKKIGHFRLKAPDNLIYPALNEEGKNNKNIEPLTSLMKWYQSNDGAYSRMDEQQLRKFCIEELEKEKTSIRNTIDQYTLFSKVNLRQLSNAYGKMDFIIGNKSIREYAFNSIYEPISNLCTECRKSDYYFTPLMNGAGHYGAVIEQLHKLDEILYSDDGTSVYAIFSDKLLHDLETFRAKIYGIDPEYDEVFPVELHFSFPQKGNNKDT